MYEDNSPQSYESTAKVGVEPTFFGKVMTFFALAILASAAGIFVTNMYWMGFFTANPALIYVLFAVDLGIIFTSRYWSKKIPLNRFLFGLFAFITGVTIAPLLTVVAATPGGAAILTKALLATGCMFTATAVIGWTTKFDLSGLRGFLVMGLIGMIVISVIGIFLPWGSTFELIFSGAGILLFSGFTMYDFQKLKQFPEDRYIDAALMLYLDIFNLFLFILRFIIAFGRD
jgi:FtsH-binding integral membrane protein